MASTAAHHSSVTDEALRDEERKIDVDEGRRLADGTWLGERFGDFSHSGLLPTDYHGGWADEKMERKAFKRAAEADKSLEKAAKRASELEAKVSKAKEEADRLAKEEAADRKATEEANHQISSRPRDLMLR